MKRYIIEERESDLETCEECIFHVFAACPDWPCRKAEREDKKTINFVLVKEEEIE